MAKNFSAFVKEYEIPFYASALISSLEWTEDECFDVYPIFHLFHRFIYFRGRLNLFLWEMFSFPFLNVRNIFVHSRARGKSSCLRICIKKCVFVEWTDQLSRVTFQRWHLGAPQRASAQLPIKICAPLERHICNTLRSIAGCVYLAASCFSANEVS